MSHGHISSFSLSIALGVVILNRGFYMNAPILLNLRERSDRVLDSRRRGHGFRPHRRHCVVVFEQDTFILA